MRWRTFRTKRGQIHFALRREVLNLRDPERATRWLTDNFSSEELRRICRDVGVGSHHDRDEALLQRLAQAIALQRVTPVVVREPHYPLDPPTSVPLAELTEQEPDSPATPLERPITRPTWLELRVVGPSGESYAGAKLRVRLPDAEARTVVLDGESKWRTDDVASEGTCHVELVEGVEPAGLRKVLDGFEPKPDMPRLPAAGGSVGVVTGRSHVLVVTQPSNTCVRLVGMAFALNKAFVLPGALEGIRLLEHMYDRMPGADVLIVGHTDRTGSASRNLSLSLERAQAVAAYLRDDVDAWLGYYSPQTDFSRRWGKGEDLAMLSALPRDHAPYYGEHHAEHSFSAAVRRFQEAHLLPATGEVDERTRRALIADYMALDETTLPSEVSITAHGCGEHFLAVQTDDDVPEPENRRVEVFFFARGIDPAPPGSTSSTGSTAYPAWREAVEEERTFRPTAEGLGMLRLITDIEYELATQARVSFLLESSDGIYSQLLTPEQHAKSAKGYVDLVFEDVPRLSFLTLSMRDAEGSDQVLFEDVPFRELDRLGQDPGDPLVDPFSLKEVQ